MATVLLALTVTGCGSRRTSTKVKLPPPVKNPRVGWTEVGRASWYGHPYHGRTTSNGEKYDMNAMTAAHKRLPFNTWLRVRNLINGRTTEVRINDRGPFVGRRIIDLSRAAATDIGMIAPGTARVRLTVIRRPSRSNAQRTSRGPDRTRSAQSQAGRRRFDIQIGVFSKRQNAEALARRAKQEGHRVNVSRFTRSGSKWYRVVVPGGSEQQAKTLLQSLKGQGFDGVLRPR